MNGQISSRLSAMRLIWLLIFATPASGSPISVTNQKGRAILIELVSVADSSVTFRRAGNPKEFTLPISSFSQESQDLILKEASNIPMDMPKIRTEVVIGKRRDKGDSYYMVRQEVTCTVKLTNTSLTTAVPPISGKIVFIGQDRRSPDQYIILSTQSVAASIDHGKTFSKEMESFVTTYDSDNKGLGNSGGYQYFGYILVMLDEAGNVAVDQTTSSGLRRAISNNPGVLKQIVTYPVKKLLTEKLKPAPID